MNRQRNLTGTIQLYLWLLSSLVVIVLGYLWVGGEIDKAALHEVKIHETLLGKEKEALKGEVEHAAAHITYMRSQLEQRVRTEVRARTEEAHKTAVYIYTQNKGKKSLVEIGQLIHDALYAASWDEGRGYYFAEDMQGTELINRNNPELEGTNIINVQDSVGKYIVKDIISVARSEQKEGFCSYSWNRPGNPEVLVPKISYVKYFEPLDWVIGNGAYLDDEEEQIKKEALDWFEQSSTIFSSYVFAGTVDGDILSGPGKGKNMWEVSDSKGFKVVQGLIGTAMEGGGFVEYVMPKLEGEKPAPKLSYATLIPGWQWYIGTGVYIDYIENQIAKEQDASQKIVQKIIIQVVLVLCFFLFLSLSWSWLLTTKIKKNLGLFIEFFRKSSLEELIIPIDKIYFREFQDLALTANQMAKDRQQAWDNLSAEQERLTVTLKSIGDGVMTTDIEGRVVLLNKVAEKLTGWSNQEAAGKPSTEVFRIINEKTGQKCLSPVFQVLDVGRTVEFTNPTALIAKDGTQRSIADSAAPIRDKESNVIGVVLVFQDVTNERKTEDELLKIRKLESVGVLAGGIAHDFNNILSAILGNIELVGFRIDKEDIGTITLLSAAKKATKRATKLTGQLLTFSKGGDPVKEETSLALLIAESADFVLHGSKVVCSYNFPHDLWKVDVDSGQIGQVIQNIIINAKQAMPEGGTILIECANIYDITEEALLNAIAGDFVRILIQDTGFGISKAIIDKVFDPYFTTKQEGSGLGLAICHSIVNKHNGYLRVNSIADKGSTFTLYLPAIRSTEEDSVGGRVRSNPQTGKSARVMVMDDEEMLLDVAKAQLVVLGHEPVVVNDGVKAISRYTEMLALGTPVDLVIMDLTIPGGMGGQEAAEKLLEIDPDAKIIVASGYSNDPVMADYEKYGFCAAIAKPFDLKELGDVIATVV